MDQLLTSELIGRAKLNPKTPITGITQNAQAVEPGNLYFAVRGTKADGHAFIPDAITRGAKVIIADRLELAGQAPGLVLVPSVRSFVGTVAAAWFDYPSRKFSLVGVTGTNGKTTTVFLLRNLWRKLGYTAGMLGTVENDTGKKVSPAKLTTPGAIELQALFAEMVKNGVSHAAMEVSSIAVDQERTRGAEFDVGIFTNFTQDHLDYHGTLDEYFAAKLRFFTEYGLKTAIFNRDDEKVRQLTSRFSGLDFSLRDSKAAFFADKIDFTSQGTRARLSTPEGRFEFQSRLVGEHNLYNALCALAANHALGLDLTTSLEAFREVDGAPGRLERVMDGEVYPTILVDYAHTDDALANVLRAVRKLRDAAGRGRVITVFGCGGDRDRTKRPKMAKAAAANSDFLIVTSDNPRTEDPEAIIQEILTGIPSGTGYHQETDRRKAITWVLGEANPSDFVVIAGKGHETYQIIGKEEFPFDDRQVVRDYYRLQSN